VVASALQVVLDGRWIRVDSGIGRYSYELARALPKAAPDVALEILLPEKDDPLVQDLAERPDGFRAVHLKGEVQDARGIAELVSLLGRRRPCIYHAPDWMALPPLPGAWRTIATIHDLIPLVAREEVSRSFKGRHPWLYRSTLSLLMRLADAVLTDTEVWAEEIRGRLGIPPERVHAIPLGVASPPSRDESKIRAVRERYALGDRPYFLFVGRPEPYKGLVPLIRAFARTESSTMLVLAGPLDPRYPEASQVVHELGLEARVRITGLAEEAALQALYDDATAFVTLSRLEGFGLPPLEAMARGVPVLAGRCSVFPEVLDGAALLVDVESESEVVRALQEIAGDGALRRRLAQQGRERASGFTWERCAASTAAIYRRVAQSRKGRRPLA
jgi:glycosyltransferase involved in cell wall biosynthesis